MIDDNMIQDYRQQRARRAYIICIMLFVSISIMNMLGGQQFQQQNRASTKIISTSELTEKSYIDMIQLLQLYDPRLSKNFNELQYNYKTVPFVLPTEIYDYSKKQKNTENDLNNYNNQNKNKNLDGESNINNEKQININDLSDNTNKNKENINTNNTYQNPFLSQYEKYMTNTQKQQYQQNLEFLKKTLKTQDLTQKEFVYYLFKKLSQQSLVGYWINQDQLNMENENNLNEQQSQNKNANLNKNDIANNFFGSQNIFQFENNKGMQYVQIQQVLGQQKLEISYQTYDGDYIDRQKLEFEIDITPNLNFQYEIGNKEVKLIQQIQFTKTNSYSNQLDSYSCLGNIVIDFNYNTKSFPFYFEKDYPPLGLNLECQGKNFQIQLVMDKIGKNDFWQQALSYSLLIAALAMVQLYGTLKVLKNIIHNPQDSNRYSLKAISAVFIWDGMFVGNHILFSVQNFDIFQYLMPPSVLFMVLWVIFERILMLQIWKLQNHVTIDNENMFRKELVVFHLKIYFVICLLMIWGQYVIFSDFLFICVNLITTLQICHTAYKGQQLLLDKYYIWCVILPRSIIPLYIRGCPYNIFHLEPSFFVTFFIVVLIIAQVLILYAQQYFGPRFFVPDFLQPNKYNYFLKIPQNRDIEQGVDPEFAEDCTICVTPLYQDAGIDLNDENSQNNQFYRRLRRRKNQIMRTPCNHKFHITCLSNWMNIKMECPSCRSKLPPI